MRSILMVLLAAATAAAALAPSTADAGRRWRGSHVGEISRNVITPYYVGYYGSHYSYYRPDPVYFYPYVADPDYACWVWPYYGPRFKAC
jgi:hypothetical protein